MNKICALMMTVAASAITMSSPVYAQAAPQAAEGIRTYDIDAGTMKVALDAWARQSKRQIIYRIEDVRTLRSSGVHGKHSELDALKMILAGSGLEIRRDRSGAIAVMLPIAPTGAVTDPAAVPVAASAAPVSPNAKEGSTEGPGLQDIVVTARRTEERSQNVPISITAFTQDSLREKGIASATDLQNFTPSLSVLGDVSRVQETYTLRGLGGNAVQGSGSGPGVVGYFAEVPSSASGPGNFFDLASLQVLNGPQGTLFGRNSTGGAVLLEPARPKLNKTEGYFEGIVGSLDRRSGQGAVNIPVIDDRLAIRVAGQFDKRNGYVHDAVTGRDYLNHNNYSVRVGIQFNPTDTISSYTAANYINVDEHGGGSILLSVNPAGPYAALLEPYLAEQQARSVRSTALSVPTRDVEKNLLILNNTQWRATDTLTIKNIVSYGRSRSTSAVDRDSTPLPISDLLGAYPGSYNNNLRTFTEELQARYEHGPLTIQGGGFFLDDKTVAPLTFQTVNPLQAAGIFGGGPVVLPPALQAALGVDSPLLPALTLQPDAETHDRSRAVYAQAQYKFTPKLTATAGFRWTWDTYGGSIQAYQAPESYDVFNQLASLGVISQAQAAQIVGLNAGLCVYEAYEAVAAGKFPTVKYPNCTSVTFGGKSNGPTGQIGLDWQADAHTLLYAVSRRGYKSGAINPIVSLFLGEGYPLFTVKPERVTDAEIGLKRDWTFGTVKARTNISAFYTWFDDIQVVQRAAIAGSDILANAQKARVLGVEAQGVIVPFKALTLSATYSFNSAKYLDYQTIAIPAIPQALTAAQPSADLRNVPFSFVPKHKYSIDARLALPIPRNQGDLAIRATWSWQSRERVAPDPQPFDTIAPYGLLGLRLEWNDVHGAPVDLAVFGTNVLGKEYRITANPSYNNAGFAGSIYGEPAEYGASARFRF